jgi:hypothetical protein
VNTTTVPAGTGAVWLDWILNWLMVLLRVRSGCSQPSERAELVGAVG